MRQLVVATFVMDASEEPNAAALEVREALQGFFVPGTGHVRTFDAFHPRTGELADALTELGLEVHLDGDS